MKNLQLFSAWIAVIWAFEVYGSQPLLVGVTLIYIAGSLAIGLTAAYLYLYLEKREEQTNQVQ